MRGTAAVLATALALAPAAARAQAWPDAPPNLVQATPTVPDAVPEEARIVAGQGLVFVNIPIVFDNPTERDQEARHRLRDPVNRPGHRFRPASAGATTSAAASDR